MYYMRQSIYASGGIHTTTPDRVPISTALRGWKADPRIPFR